MYQEDPSRRRSRRRRTRPVRRVVLRGAVPPAYLAKLAPLPYCSASLRVFIRRRSRSGAPRIYKKSTRAQIAGRLLGPREPRAAAPWSTRRTSPSCSRVMFPVKTRLKPLTFLPAWAVCAAEAEAPAFRPRAAAAACLTCRWREGVSPQRGGGRGGRGGGGAWGSFVSRRLAEELRRQDGAATDVVERDWGGLISYVAAHRGDHRYKTELWSAAQNAFDDFALRIRHVGLRRAHEVRRHDAALAVVELPRQRLPPRPTAAPRAHLDDRTPGCGAATPSKRR